MKTELFSFQKGKNRISSGILSFDRLISKGFIQNSVNVVVGDTGTGKSSFAWHFIGFDEQPVIYMSLEESLKQIEKEAASLGLSSIESKIKKGKFFFIPAFEGITSSQTSGEVAKTFFDKELPKKIDEFKEIAKANQGLKVVIDPLTPLLFEINELKIQREVINRIFRTLRKIGTTLITLEKGFGEQLVKIPLFLADSVIELDFLGLGSIYNRTLTIKKFRGSSHTEKPVPFMFKKGQGIVIMTE